MPILIFICGFTAFFCISVYIFSNLKLFSFKRNNSEKLYSDFQLPPLEKTQKKIELINEKIVPPKYSKFISRTIEQAGLENKLTRSKFVLIQQEAFIALIIFFIIIGAFKKDQILTPLLLSMGAGVLIPLLFLSMRAKAMRGKIINSIPFFADMLTLSCEAGLDIFASLLYILQNSEKTPLMDMIGSILKEIRMGKSRQTALREAYKKTDIWDLKTIYLTILQSESLGVPIGRSLRSQVEMMRRSRMNKAEKLAQEAPFKLMIPLLFFIFPVTFIVLLTPLIIRFFEGNSF